jgi:hypothetical protein
VTAPARALGVHFEDDEVASRITAAAASEPGALPLLSYLLTDMWAAMVRRGDATLNMPAKAIDIGGVLASRAEEFLKANPDEEKPLRRLLTLRIAVVPPEGEPMRRHTTREECTEAEWSLAARLAEHPWRLVVMGEREADSRVIAEVAHEALLRAWPRLAHWLREEREFLVFKGEAKRAERRWRHMGRVDRALLTGLDLARAEEWLPTRSEDLSEEVIDFVQCSIAANRNARERQFYDVIRTSRSYAVLILGRFTDERKVVLDALREELRKRDYLPILFDFDKPTSQTTDETITLIARMSRFVIADISDAKSVLQELRAIVPDLPSVPVQPVIPATQEEPGMFDFLRNFRSFLKVHRYNNQQQLIADLGERVIDPAEGYIRSVRERRLARPD